MNALRRQIGFPLDQVELILAGSPEQVEEWELLCRNPAPFGAAIGVEAGGALYYALKNKGAQVATGEIIAFTDSDVYPAPTWIASIVSNIRAGADVSVGLSLFKDASGWTATSVARAMAVSCTFGYILGPSKNGRVELRGFMDHNLAIRADLFRNAQYQTEYGRIIASPLLFRRLKKAGAVIAFSPLQAVTHYFGWRYWLRNLHFRYGNEVYRLRRLDGDYPNQWIRWAGPLEPPLTMLWHMMLDVPRWFRFCRAKGISPFTAALSLPGFLIVSGSARFAEVLGMYATMAAPVQMERWAQSV
ncbi:MAG: glycosyltransferase family 2 protein [Bryobacteraceae bacterium]|nr:glycosyltransferase family 2 protein [Bryobacteraceae bacterium]